MKWISCWISKLLLALFCKISSFQNNELFCQTFTCSFLVLTKDCPSFQGPLDVDCLLSLWLEAGCTRKGERAPTKLSDAQSREEWQDFNLQ